MYAQAPGAVLLCCSAVLLCLVLGLSCMPLTQPAQNAIGNLETTLKSTLNTCSVSSSYKYALTRADIKSHLHYCGILAQEVKSGVLPKGYELPSRPELCARCPSTCPGHQEMCAERSKWCSVAGAWLGNDCCAEPQCRDIRSASMLIQQQVLVCGMSSHNTLILVMIAM